ncbi:MAG TPA: phosphodiester glycosidase family protein [Rudaea sp.]|nr:phosphodiester glycosidase family protein [Rudaea sp.]
MLIFAALLTVASAAADIPTTWQTLAPGFDEAQLPLDTGAPITVLRFDPHEWQLEFVGIGNSEEPAQSARDWSRRRGFAAAINAGMFQRDYRTHIGFLKFRDHIGSSRTNDYRSVAAFDAGSPNLPAFRMFDLDVPGLTMKDILADYASATQNLRLIRRPGINQWPPQERRWSEAALGEDRDGRILFIFSRAPLSMHDFNERLLASDIGVVAAQHLEGGPEAQLYMHLGEAEHEWFGSYETSFREDDTNAAAWPIPNVLGVRRRGP